VAGWPESIFYLGRDIVFEPALASPLALEVAMLPGCARLCWIAPLALVRGCDFIGLWVRPVVWILYY